MRAHPFGRTGQPVPVVGIGTWNMERDPRPAAVRAIQRALDLGMTHVDTAELYGMGRVETMVGEAIAGRRDQIFLVSKVLPRNASRKGTVAACEASLKRLRTDHLDCYLLHWWEGHHPFAETVAAMEQLEQDGKIRSWGVSNLDEEELDEVLAVAGPGRIACNQVLYHLLERRIEHRVLPWCERHGVALVGYSPFGSGNFPAPGSAGHDLLTRVGAAHGASPRQVALAFLARRPSLFTIPKSSDASRVGENGGAGDLVLTEAELSALEAAFPLGEDQGGVPYL